MDWIGFLQSTLPGLGRTLGLLIAIVVPLTIVIELVKELGFFTEEPEGGRQSTGRVMRWLGMSDQAAMPLAAGFFFGLAYGAGLILQFAEDGALTKRDRVLVTIFLVACHAVVEDTLLFVPLGVNPLFLFVFRFGVAILLTAGAARIVPHLRPLAQGHAPTDRSSA